MKSDCLKRVVNLSFTLTSSPKSLSAAPVRAIELNCKCNEPVNTVFVKTVIRLDTPTYLPYSIVFYDDLLSNHAEIAVKWNF